MYQLLKGGKGDHQSMYFNIASSTKPTMTPEDLTIFLETIVPIAIFMDKDLGGMCFCTLVFVRARIRWCRPSLAVGSCICLPVFPGAIVPIAIFMDKDLGGMCVCVCVCPLVVVPCAHAYEKGAEQSCCRFGGYVRTYTPRRP